jgi:hypothetical protein
MIKLSGDCAVGKLATQFKPQNQEIGNLLWKERRGRRETGDILPICY